MPLSLPIHHYQRTVRAVLTGVPPPSRLAARQRIPLCSAGEARTRSPNRTAQSTLSKFRKPAPPQRADPARE